MCDFSRMPTFSILNDTDLGLSDAVYKSWVLCCNCKFCTYTSCIHISNHMKTECVHDSWKQLASRFICITRLLFTISRVEENSGRDPLISANSWIHSPTARFVRPQSTQFHKPNSAGCGNIQVHLSCLYFTLSALRYRLAAIGIPSRLTRIDHTFNAHGCHNAVPTSKKVRSYSPIP